MLASLNTQLTQYGIAGQSPPNIHCLNAFAFSGKNASFNKGISLVGHRGNTLLRNVTNFLYWVCEAINKMNQRILGTYARSLYSGKTYMCLKLSMAMTGQSAGVFWIWRRGWRNFSQSACRKLIEPARWGEEDTFNCYWQ